MPEPLITVQDFAAVTGVVEVFDCAPQPGHVTLIVPPGLADMVADDIADRHAANLRVHIEEQTTMGDNA